MSRIKKKFQGVSSGRYSREPLEKLFAEEWQKQNDKLYRSGATLDYLLSENEDQHNPMPRSNEDHVKAATVIQWLGSPVGQGFLEKVIRKAKKRKIDLPMLWKDKDDNKTKP